MYWSRVVIICIAMGHALSGCSFRPLYGQESHEAVPSHLHDIKIDLISDRSGQLLRNQLLTALCPEGEPTLATYRLHVDLVEAKMDLGFRQDATASRTQISLEAKFTLYDTITNKIIQEGKVRSTADFNILSDTPYSTFVGEQDARERALKDIGDNLKRRLAAFFIQQGNAS